MAISKKCLVLDLDNTLWGGVVGEDGPQGIQLGFEPPGSYFLAFQQAILDLYNRGIILAINSKNNYDGAMEVIRHQPNMLLKEGHFAALRINWKDKPDNMRELAKELNIGLDSFVFLDDDPVNREVMRHVLPEVETPDLPRDPSDYAKFLTDLPYFKNDGFLTDEDKMRGNLYVTEKLRKASEKTFSSAGEYLKSLGLDIIYFLDDGVSVSRLSQLTQKTNQFNMNKFPLSEEEVSRYINDPRHLVIYAQAHDRFGDYGIIAFALIDRSSPEWIIKSLLISCRALGRGIEEAFLARIAREALKGQAKKLRLVFEKTEKNQPAEDFLNKHFGNYYYDLTQTSIKPEWITETEKLP